MAHMLRIFFTGAYRKPREVNWLIGIVLFTLALLEGLFGYSLPDDLLSGAGLRILEGVLQSIPVVGTYLSFFLFGGQYPGHSIIPRMYILHVLLIPALFAGADRRAPVHHVPPEAHADAGQGPDEQERRRRADVPVLRGQDRRVLPVHLRGRGPRRAPSRRSTRSGCTARTTRSRSRRARSPTSTWACSRARCA